jgi:uncharacterized membrane protein YfcA
MVSATISSGAFVWVLIGLAAGVWVTMWWELRRKRKAGEDGSVMMRRAAVAYFVIIFIGLLVALIDGGEGWTVLTALNLVIATVVLLRSWPPDGRKHLIREIRNAFRDGTV